MVQCGMAFQAAVQLGQDARATLRAETVRVSTQSNSDRLDGQVLNQ
jgi:hypothetical protein